MIGLIQTKESEKVHAFEKACDANFSTTLCWNVVDHDFLSTLLLSLRFYCLKANLIKLHAHSLESPKLCTKIMHLNCFHIELESFQLQFLHPDVGSFQKNQNLDFVEMEQN